jgi:hypothetical protein
MKRIAILLLTTGIAGAASAHEETKLEPRGCSAIDVTAPDVKKQPRNLRFSARDILDLVFVTELEQAVYGQHVLHFKVVTPSGFLYQDLAMPFDWKRASRGFGMDSVVPAAASARNVPVQQLGPVASRARPFVEARLPVAGTSITMSTLYGRWSVQAFLDDQARPCSPARAFTISSN